MWISNFPSTICWRDSPSLMNDLITFIKNHLTWTAWRSNQSILKEISPEYSLEGLILKLKLQYFGYLMWRANSLEKTLMLGKIEGRRRRGWQRTRGLDGIIDSMDMSLSKLQEMVKDRKAWLTAVHRVAKSRTRLSNWRTKTTTCRPLVHEKRNLTLIKAGLLTFVGSRARIQTEAHIRKSKYL